MNPDRLRTEEILNINRDLIERDVPYTGSEEYPVRRDKVEHLVENVPARSPISVAAYYLKNLALLQPFPDGNHRTGLIAAQTCLERKGYRFDYTSEEAEQLRNRMSHLQFKFYGTYEELSGEVTTEPDNELFHLCRDFITAHATRSWRRGSRRK